MRHSDTWPIFIPPDRLAAYKLLLDRQIISKPHLTYVRDTRTTIVEYDSEYQHDEVIAMLKKAVTP